MVMRTVKADSPKGRAGGITWTGALSSHARLFPLSMRSDETYKASSGA